MKRKLLTAGAVFFLLPLFSPKVLADPYYAPESPEPTVLLRCRETISSDRYHAESTFESSFESEHSEFYTSTGDSSADRRERRRSQIREILRRQETGHAHTGPVVIEIQGNCDAIRVDIDADSSWDEYIPDDLETSRGYEEWRESIRGRRRYGERPEEAYPWLTRTGSGWDWLIRRGSARSHETPEQNFESFSCMCITAPCHCAHPSSP
ncbi:MAG: hypothetical protein AAFQ95_07415 [Cyanobacteria bacterium J06621_3]